MNSQSRPTRPIAMPALVAGQPIELRFDTEIPASNLADQPLALHTAGYVGLVPRWRRRVMQIRSASLPRTPIPGRDAARE